MIKNIQLVSVPSYFFDTQEGKRVDLLTLYLTIDNETFNSTITMNCFKDKEAVLETLTTMIKVLVNECYRKEIK